MNGCFGVAPTAVLVAELGRERTVPSVRFQPLEAATLRVWARRSFRLAAATRRCHCRSRHPTKPQADAEDDATTYEDLADGAR